MVSKENLNSKYRIVSSNGEKYSIVHNLKKEKIFLLNNFKIGVLYRIISNDPIIAISERPRYCLYEKNIPFITFFYQLIKRPKS